MSDPEVIRTEPVSPNAPMPKHWFLNPYLTIVLSVILDAGAQMFLKIGADHSVNTTAWLGLTGLSSGWVWLGMITMVTSLGAWVYSLRFVPLNIASNLTGSVHVLVPLNCWIFLGEKISPGRWLGITMVIVGVCIIARANMRMEKKLEETR